MERSSYYTPFCNAFKNAFLNMPGVTTFAQETITDNGICKNFLGTVYINKMEFVNIVEEYGKYMVFVNNPGCTVDEEGIPVFTKEHPQQQWVFGNYIYFQVALNKAVSMTKERKYPKPKLVW